MCDGNMALCVRASHLCVRAGTAACCNLASCCAALAGARETSGMFVMSCGSGSRDMLYHCTCTSFCHLAPCMGKHSAAVSPVPTCIAPASPALSRVGFGAGGAFEERLPTSPPHAGAAGRCCVSGKHELAPTVQRRPCHVQVTSACVCADACILDCSSIFGPSAPISSGRPLARCGRLYARSTRWLCKHFERPPDHHVRPATYPVWCWRRHPPHPSWAPAAVWSYTVVYIHTCNQAFH